MFVGAEIGSPISKTSPIPSRVSIPLQIKRVSSLIYELIIKEIKSVAIFAYHYFAFYVYRNYEVKPLAPLDIKETTKVVLLIHGQGGGPFCFGSLANFLKKSGIVNLYALENKRTKVNRIPVEHIDKMIKEISEKCFAKGSTKVEFALIGHSLGSIAAYKYIWATEKDLDHRIKISMMISVSGRLKYVKNNFWWFCERIREDLIGLHAKYQKEPNKIPLYTIWGSRDDLIPKESVHIQKKPDIEHTIEGVGHGGVINDKAVHEIIKQRLDPWLKA